jgi:hypothetical protein
VSLKEFLGLQCKNDYLEYRRQRRKESGRVPGLPAARAVCRRFNPSSKLLMQVEVN